MIDYVQSNSHREGDEVKEKDYPVFDNIQHTYIQISPIHGKGLFAGTHIKKDTVLCELDGQVMPWDYYDELKKQYDEQEDYLFGEWNAIDENTLLVRALRTKYSFINHSRSPNLVVRDKPTRVVSIRDIKAHEELTLDYRKEPLRKEYISNHGKTFL